MSTPLTSFAWFDATFALGCCTIAFGLGLWSVPLAVVTFGVFMVLISVMGARRSQRSAVSAVPTTTTPINDARTADSIAA